MIIYLSDIRFGFRVRQQNPKSRFQNPNPDFPIERKLKNIQTRVSAKIMKIKP